MKILTTSQFKDLDKAAAENMDKGMVDLVDKTALALSDWVREHISVSNSILVFAGTGNNGADGIALARLLHEEHYKTYVYLINYSDKRSEANTRQLELYKQSGGAIMVIDDAGKLPDLDSKTIVIDALLGTGSNRKMEGLLLETVKYLNEQKAVRIAIDLPSGLNPDSHSEGPAVEANITLVLEAPKLALMFAENEKYVGEWYLIPLNLHPAFIRNLKTQLHLISADLATNIIKSHPRKKFSHKGTFGKALIAGGSRGKYGAVLMAVNAALRSGCGYVTAHIPAEAAAIMHTVSPQTLVEADKGEKEITTIPDPALYDAFAIGIGMGVSRNTESALESFLDLVELEHNVVLDADAINIIAKSKHLQGMLSPNTIITPHIKEFERLAGKADNDYERMEQLQNLSAKLNCIIILKGAHTMVSLPDGHIFFNSTGNVGLAKAGSGDALTGLLAGLLAQGLQSFEAALLGIYIHGLAADLAAKTTGTRSMLIEDVIGKFAEAFNSIEPKPILETLL